MRNKKNSTELNGININTWTRLKAKQNCYLFMNQRISNNPSTSYLSKIKQDLFDWVISINLQFYIQITSSTNSSWEEPTLSLQSYLWSTCFKLRLDKCYQCRIRFHYFDNSRHDLDFTDNISPCKGNIRHELNTNEIKNRAGLNNSYTLAPHIRMGQMQFIFLMHAFYSITVSVKLISC